MLTVDGAPSAAEPNLFLFALDTFHQRVQFIAHSTKPHRPGRLLLHARLTFQVYKLSISGGGIVSSSILTGMLVEGPRR